jgi:hypothetical protein
MQAEPHSLPPYHVYERISIAIDENLNFILHDFKWNNPGPWICWDSIGTKILKDPKPFSGVRSQDSGSLGGGIDWVVAREKTQGVFLGIGCFPCLELDGGYSTVLIL